MKKSFLAVAAVLTLALTAGTPAHAQRGVAAGVAAGIIGGAIVGGALASPYYYGPGPGYYEPGYYPPATTPPVGLCRRRLLRQLRLAEAALLGWLCLARPPRQSLWLRRA